MNDPHLREREQAMSIFLVAGNNQPPATTAQQTQAASANVAVTPAADPSLQPSDNTNVDANGNQVPSTAAQEPTVVLDGSLSRIYTQALNLAYAKEDTGTMALIIDAQARADKDAAANKDNRGVYVYTTDADSLDNNEVIHIANWISDNQKAQKSDMIISLESTRNKISKHSGLLEELARNTGVTIVYSRSSALEMIQNKLKK